MNNSPYALKRLKLIESQSDGFQVQLGPEREMIELVLDGKALQAEGGIDRQEDVVALRPDPLGRGLGQGRIGFERLMEDFHFPPFLIDCFNRRWVAVEVATSQIQDPGAAVLVRKDLLAQQHGETQSLEPSLNRFLFLPC